MSSASDLPRVAAPFAAEDAELRDVSSRVGLLGAATPTDAEVERRRLLDDYARGDERLPRWTYEPSPRTEMIRRLDALLSRLEGHEDPPLTHLYRERTRELRLEALAAEAVGRSELGARARERFATPRSTGDADDLAKAWLAVPAGDLATNASCRVVSDAREPQSLVSRMRAEVMRRRLPFTVKTSAALSALAAVSGDTIWVAEGRSLSAEDVERTVMHEIEAHAVPRTRARARPLGLFAIGTARGSDEQEGYALWLEENRGFLGVTRRAELAARHVAVSQMHAGADFVSVVRYLRREASASLALALRTAERAFRGSLGKSPGLGRERVYLPAFLEVKRRLAAHPGDEAVLSAGQVAVDAIDVLRAWSGE